MGNIISFLQTQNKVTTDRIDKYKYKYHDIRFDTNYFSNSVYKKVVLEVNAEEGGYSDRTTLRLYNITSNHVLYSTFSPVIELSSKIGGVTDFTVGGIYYTYNSEIVLLNTFWQSYLSYSFIQIDDTTFEVPIDYSINCREINYPNTGIPLSPPIKLYIYFIYNNPYICS